jgi:hypothetical protein
MGIVTGLAGLVLGAVAAWQLARGFAAAEMSRLRTRLEERIGFWQGETERARVHAAQVAERTAAWVAGCQQGRDDVLSLARALGQHTAQAGSSSSVASSSPLPTSSGPSCTSCPTRSATPRHKP